ncbi:hypothetical protein [Bifidobacterium crudilactis]|jgi:hypothetical protein|uniref:hypothetical protein n=1 Tax=Bifidobacterium crudilactis TaxID=327277 RepID=UPI002357D5B1|nr:hypothetical protein [Bifidobacterium crudilactis]MCI1217155.1 hypothetical protein [Bifidobacterium crudilactis]
MNKRRLYTRVAEALLGAFDGAELGWRYGNVVALRPADASHPATATGGQSLALVGGKGAHAPATDSTDRNAAAIREDLNEEYRQFVASDKAGRAER